MSSIKCFTGDSLWPVAPGELAGKWLVRALQPSGPRVTCCDGASPTPTGPGTRFFWLLFIQTISFRCAAHVGRLPPECVTVSGPRVRRGQSGRRAVAALVG